MWLEPEILHSGDAGGGGGQAWEGGGGEPLLWQQRKHTNCTTAN